MKLNSDFKINILSLLLKHGSDIESPDEDGETILILACGKTDYWGDPALVRFLLEKGALDRYEALDKNGKLATYDALEEAERVINLEAAKLIAEHRQNEGRK
jgi:ankyrin repeat protein